MKYRVCPLNPTLCHVMHDAEPQDYSKVTLAFNGPDRPLTVIGPFDVPPYVQESAYDFFMRVAAIADERSRILEAAYTKSWVPEPPQVDAPQEP